jgi:hypothetical protein
MRSDWYQPAVSDQDFDRVDCLLSMSQGAGAATANLSQGYGGFAFVL